MGSAAQAGTGQYRAVPTRVRDLVAAPSDVIVRLVGLVILTLSAFAPWIATRASGTGRVDIAQLAISKWVFAALVALLILASVFEWTGFLEAVGRWTVTLCSVLMLIVPLLALITINVVSVWAAPSLLPSSLRRLSFGVSPLIGIWLAFIGAGLILISATGSAAGFTERLSDFGHGFLNRNPSSLALVFLVVGVPLLEIGRYGAWINLDTHSDHWSMPGFAVPWLGLFTLIAQIGVLLLAVACFVRPHFLSGLALVVVGWILTIPPAVILIAASGTPQFTVPPWLREHLVHWSAQVHDLAHGTPASSYVPHIPTTLTGSVTAGTGTVTTYFAGASVAFGGLLVCRAMNREAA
jgi:hypothetical protein